MQAYSNTINILTNKGVRTVDGQEYDADAVIFATGFDLEVRVMIIFFQKQDNKDNQEFSTIDDGVTLMCLTGQLQSTIFKKEKMMIIIAIIIRIHLIILIITRLVQSLTLKKD